MWVVKLGGSLHGVGALRRTLDDVLSAADREMIIVPGGGLFADAAREAQRRYGFDDEHAHAMAIAAMEQYALLLRALAPRLTPLRSLARLPRLLPGLRRRRRIPLWFPYSAGAATAAGVPASWEATADSLALWLAGELAAGRGGATKRQVKLLLLKSVAAPCADIAELARRGCVDRFFPSLAARLQLPVAWLNVRAAPPASRVLRGDTVAAACRLINPPRPDDGKAQTGDKERGDPRPRSPDRGRGPA